MAVNPLNEGLERTAELVDADIVDGIAGTGTTAPDPTDTALETPVATTEADVSTIRTGTTIQITHIIPSTAGTGNTLTEWLVRMNSESSALFRTITAGVVHTSADEIARIHTLTYQRE